MAVNIKLGVDMSALKSGIQDANAQIKAFDAQLKVAETTFKKTGDAEAAMSTKTDALTNKLKTQKQMVRQYEEALAKMRANEVDPMSKSYKQLEAAMLNMQSAANETEIQLRDLSTTQLTAASSADKLTQSVNSIGKKMSLDQVIGGIDKITGGLENAAKKAVDLGEQLWNNIMNKAQWADDTATMAMMYGIDLDTFLRMQKLVTNGLDTSVDAILTSQSKLKRGIGSDAKNVAEALNEMGISMMTFVGEGKYGAIEQAKDSLELFWEVGQKLMTWGDEYQKEDMAQKLFGKGWKELVPLFRDYKTLEDYKKALDNVNVNSEEDVNALAELNDKIGELKGNLETLSTDILAKLAPALSQGADALNGLLTKLLEYLNKPEGQAMLERLGTAISGLFEDIGEIDPQQVIEGFTGVFNTIVDGLKWLWENKENVVEALKWIVAGWAGLKLTGGALEIMKLINGVKDFQGVPTAPPQNVTSGNGEVIANGNTGGGWLSPLLNTLVSGMPTNFVMEEAFKGWREGQKMQAEWKKATEGMTQVEKDAYTLKLSLGISDEEAKNLAEKMNENPPEVTVETVPEANAAEKIAQDVGKVILPAELRIMGGGVGLGGGGEMLSLFSGNKRAVYSNVNGISFVPYDGYLSVLHKGERVMPAVQNKNYTYNNHTYFGSVNLNNGLEVDALTESIERNNRRKRGGYGAN